MYLKERIISLFIFLIILLVNTFIISKSKSKTVRFILKIYCIELAIMAFFYIPSKTTDLYRLIEISKEYGKYINNSNFFHNLYNSRPLEFLLLYINGKIGIYNLLPAFTSLVFYGLFFKIIYDFYDTNKISSKTLGYTLFTFMIFGQFAIVISGIRSFLVFSILSYCIYKDLYKNKSFVKTIPVYLFLTLLHPVSLILLFIRIMYYLFYEKKSKSKLISSFFIIMVLALIFITVGYTYINETINIANKYLNGKVYSYIWEYIIGIFIIVLIMISNYCIKSNHKVIFNYINTQYKINSLYKFCSMLFIFSIISIIEYTIFTRFLIVLTILYMPIFIGMIENLKMINYERKKVYVFMINLIIIVIFSLVFTRGNLSGLKFFIG